MTEEENSNPSANADEGGQSLGCLIGYGVAVILFALFAATVISTCCGHH